jgi:4-amino-4-deoxy-L-arabinose transferase-like glycosyltransferase
MRRWQSLLALTALWAALYLPGLGGPELKGEEGRRILPALEMLKTGEWILPVMEGQPYVRKPPLINWAIAASVSATGTISELSARLPSVLSVLALALTGAVLLRGFITGPGASASDQARAALLLGVMLLLHAGLFSKGRLAEIEALYVALTGIALALWIHLWREEASPWLTYTLPWLWLGLGLLAKGPPHLFFFYGVVVAVLWKSRSLSELRHPAHATGVIVMLGVFAPWALAVKGKLSAVKTDVKAGATWIDQLTERFSFEQFDAVDWLTGPLWALLIILPWGWVLPVFWKRLPSLAGTPGSRDAALADGLRWGVILTAAAVLVIPATRPRFVQPLTLPALTLCALVAWRGLPSLWQMWWSRLALAAAALLSVLGVAAPFFVPVLRDARHNALIASLATAGVALAVWRLWIKLSTSPWPPPSSASSSAPLTPPPSSPPENPAKTLDQSAHTSPPSSAPATSPSSTRAKPPPPSTGGSTSARPIPSSAASARCPTMPISSSSQPNKPTPRIIAGASSTISASPTKSSASPTPSTTTLPSGPDSPRQTDPTPPTNPHRLTCACTKAPNLIHERRHEWP